MDPLCPFSSPGPNSLVHGALYSLFLSPYLPELHTCPASLPGLGSFTRGGSSSHSIPVNWGDGVGIVRGKEWREKTVSGAERSEESNSDTNSNSGVFQHHQAILRYQLDVLEFNSILTPSTWRYCQIPQGKGSVPQYCSLLPFPVQGSCASDQPTIYIRGSHDPFFGFN